MICPDCEGRKEIIGIFPVWAEDVPLEKRKPYVELPCMRCKSTGEVSDEMVQWMKDGEKLKDKRIALKLTLRKAYIQVSSYYYDDGDLLTKMSEMERGVIKPDMQLYDGLIPETLLQYYKHAKGYCENKIMHDEDCSINNGSLACDCGLLRTLIRLENPSQWHEKYNDQIDGHLKTINNVRNYLYLPK